LPLIIQVIPLAVKHSLRIHSTPKPVQAPEVLEPQRSSKRIVIRNADLPEDLRSYINEFNAGRLLGDTATMGLAAISGVTVFGTLATGTYWSLQTSLVALLSGFGAIGSHAALRKIAFNKSEQNILELVKSTRRFLASGHVLKFYLPPIEKLSVSHPYIGINSKGDLVLIPKSDRKASAFFEALKHPLTRKIAIN
jgi:hypothetical protein